MPDLSVTKTHTGDFYQGQTGATYTITVTNNGTGFTFGTVSVTDTLPGTMTATAISGTGWTCDLGSLTCTSTQTVAQGSSFPPITVTVNVGANAAFHETNTATVSGSGDNTPANDTANDDTHIKATQAITFGALANQVLGAPDFTVSASASSGLPVSFAASGSCTVSGNTVHLLGLGSCTITASQGGDVDYLPAPDVAQSFSILYSTGACLGSPGHSILPPINPAGTTVAKQGSTVPAKFRVCDFSGDSVGTPGVVSSFRLIQIISGVPTNVDAPVGSTTPDTAFRFDPTGQQWIFNINTSALSAGNRYVFRISLNDGSNIDFSFGTK